jgi:enoyl-CoA hydratase/carnithine racemase
LNPLEQALADASQMKTTAALEDPFAAVLKKYHEMTPVDPSDSFLAKQRADIDHIFSIENNESLTVEEILDKLAQLNTDFGTQTLETLHKMSPTSMKITLEGLKRGTRAQSVGEDLQMEFRMSQRCTRHKDTDFMEGVRALLVDKDKKPQWNPAKVEDVPDDLVAEFFAPVEQEWEIPTPTDDIVVASSKL